MACAEGRVEASWATYRGSSPVSPIGFPLSTNEFMIRRPNAEKELDTSAVNVRHFQHLRSEPTLMSETPPKLPDDESKRNRHD